MRLKTSNKALMKAIHKDREFMDSAYLKMKDKIPENMTRQEWEKNLSITPEADKQELEYIIEMKKKYAVLNEIQKRDLITVRVKQAEMYIHSLKTKLEHNDYVDMKSYREGHGAGRQDFIKACNVLLFDRHKGIAENLFLEQDSDIPELLRTYREMLEEILLEEKDTAPDEVPELQNLNKLTEGTSPVLRKWTGGKYKCCSLERFIKEYQKLSDYLTPALIRDYLISDRNGKPYTDSTIEQRIKEYRT